MAETTRSLRGETLLKESHRAAWYCAARSTLAASRAALGDGATCAARSAASATTYAALLASMISVAGINDQRSFAT
jgi:hypothetical protein